MNSTDGFDYNYEEDYVCDSWDDYMCGYELNEDYYTITKPNYYNE